MKQDFMEDSVYAFEGFRRNPNTKEIDVKQTMQAFAEKLLSLRDSEKKLRTNRRIKASVLKSFEQREKLSNLPDIIRLEALALDVTNRMKLATSEQYYNMYLDVKGHIYLNNGKYLKVKDIGGSDYVSLKP